MINLDIDLPPGAMIGGSEVALAAETAQSNGIWLHGARESFDITDGDKVMTGWRSIDGKWRAQPTEPNQGNGKLSETGDRAGLHCRMGEHCGLVLTDAIERTNIFSAAVIIKPFPPEPGRTLLTINGGGSSKSGSYLFLSDDGDKFTIKDTTESVSLVAPAEIRSDAPLLLTIMLDNDTLAFRQGFGAVHTVTGVPPKIAEPASMFIGARSHRSGLQKTLGESVIEDVFFWPGKRLLRPRHESDSTLDLALRRYFLWNS